MGAEPGPGAARGPAEGADSGAGQWELNPDLALHVARLKVLIQEQVSGS